MIENTKPFRRRGSEPEMPVAEVQPIAAPGAERPPAKALEEITPAKASPEMAEEVAFEATTPDQADAVNLERRKFFSSLVPAFGDGLVKLLRTSNNLQRDFHEAMKDGSDAIAESERKRRSSEKNLRDDS